ncbi:recombinase family protein [Actinokineospora sp. NPDC004072]
MFTIAERLTADGVLSPSARDPARNPHRKVAAWSKSAVRVILTNPATWATRCGASSTRRC